MTRRRFRGEYRACLDLCRRKKRGCPRPAAISVMLVLILGLSVPAASCAADTQKTDNKGVTFADMWRGIKSAEQNIEKEIPKIGPAIIATFDKITGKEPKKPPQSSQEPTK
jgi:predicted PurR-regulated permease PerM